jgi:hypothetical protein
LNSPEQATGWQNGVGKRAAPPGRSGVSIAGLALLSGLAFGAIAGEPPTDTPDDATDQTRQLERVRVVAPKFEDPFAFDNPVDIQGSAFDKYYRAPPTPEEISLGGGYILYGINQGLKKALQQVTRLPGWKHQVRDATARPPPLDDEQMSRAMRLREADADADAD